MPFLLATAVQFTTPLTPFGLMFGPRPVQIEKSEFPTAVIFTSLDDIRENFPDFDRVQAIRKTPSWCVATSTDLGDMFPSSPPPVHYARYS
jgi:hypothetical protein